MLLLLLNTPFLILHSIVTCVIQIAIVTSIVYGIFHRIGIVQRLLQRHIELELTKVCNGAQVTMTSLEFNLSPFSTSSFFTASTLSISELIIHTPKREEWKWDSPLIARVGKVDLSFNLFTLIEIPNFVQYTFNHIISTSATPPSTEPPFYMKSTIKDIYTAQAYDAQVFIEKRGNVFNFHLLDCRLELPNAQQVLESIGYTNGNHSTLNSTHSNDAAHVSQKGSSDSEDSQQHPHHIDSFKSHSMTSRDGLDELGENNHLAETKANEIVKSIVDVVSTLGNAVNEGGQTGLSAALRNQKDGFVSQLKKVKDFVGVKGNVNAAISGHEGGNRTTAIAKEGIQVMKQVGKVVEKNVLTMKEKVISLSKPPPMKEGWKAFENTEMFRVGFVELQDVRIFTKEIISKGKNVAPSNEKTQQQSDEDLEFDKPYKQQEQEPQHLTLGINNWSKPILVKELRIYHAELCPSSYSISMLWKQKNANSIHSLSSFDKAALIGQPIDQIGNIILRRALAEIAKTNTGQILTNAFSEVFAWFDVET